MGDFSYNLNDVVRVSPLNKYSSINRVYIGRVWKKENIPLNRAQKNCETIKCAYIDFTGCPRAYSDLLKRGSNLYCRINNKPELCIVREIDKIDGKDLDVVVIIEDGRYNIGNPEYKISGANIISIMIAETGYDIYVLSE